MCIMCVKNARMNKKELQLRDNNAWWYYPYEIGDFVSIFGERMRGGYKIETNSENLPKGLCLGDTLQLVFRDCKDHWWGRKSSDPTDYDLGSGENYYGPIGEIISCFFISNDDHSDFILVGKKYKIN